MWTVSSYGVEIRKQNILVRQTMEIYRQAVGYLTEIYAQVWEELRKIPETKKRFNTAEHMVHMTKKNTACVLSRQENDIIVTCQHPII